MNPPQSTYRHDFVGHNWIVNNINTPDEEYFCTSENVDDCLKYISQEFSTLGLPSIYSKSNLCENAVNCDIISLLNAVFELLKNLSNLNCSKEDLESRNHILFSDLQSVNKKNSQLRENADQCERKLRAALERERQLKVSSEKLSQALGSEKEAARKLQSQMQQQKVVYQHETRKMESSMNQMKCRLSQVITDKSSEKRVAHISPSQFLQRSTKERGKWKTGSAVKSSVEEMHSSMIAAYENRCQEMGKDIMQLRDCLEHAYNALQEVVHAFEDKNKENRCPIEIESLKVFWNVPSVQQEVKEIFNLLLAKIKENGSKIAKDSSENLQQEISMLRSKLMQYRKLLEQYEESGKIEFDEAILKEDANGPFEFSVADKQQLDSEKERLNEEKLNLLEAQKCLEKEKREVEVQKLNLIRLSTRRDACPESQWPHSLGTLQSFAVLTTRGSLIAVPSSKDLRQCLSSPEQRGDHLHPLWKATVLSIQEETEDYESEPFKTTAKSSPAESSSSKSSPAESSSVKSSSNKSSPTESSSSKSSPAESSSAKSFPAESFSAKSSPAESFSAHGPVDNFPEPELPNWAKSARNVPLSGDALPDMAALSIGEHLLADSFVDDPLNVSTWSEDQNFSLLRAAVEDIDNRRGNLGEM